MKLIKYIEALTCWSGMLAALLIVPLIGSLVVEVVSRYVLGSPTLWAFEISYMVTGAIFMLAMANALRINMHVSVDLFTLMMSPRIHAAIRLFSYMIFLPIIAWLVWELSKYAYGAFESKERSGKSAWNPIIWPIYTVWFVGFLMLSLQIFAELVKAFRVLVFGQEVEAE